MLGRAALLFSLPWLTSRLRRVARLRDAGDDLCEIVDLLQKISNFSESDQRRIVEEECLEGAVVSW